MEPIGIYTVKNSEPNLDLSQYSKENPYKILSISHTDLDGYSCTILAKLIAKSNPVTVDTLNISPNRIRLVLDEIADTLNQYDRIYITDLSPNEDVVNIVTDLHLEDKVLVFDHHMTTLAEIPSWITIAKYARNDPYSAVYRPTDDEGANWLTCATMIFYNYIKRSPFWKNILEDILHNPSGSAEDDNIQHYCTSVECYDTFSFWKMQMDGTLENYVKDSGASYMIDGPRINALFHCIDHELFENVIYDYFACHIPTEQMTQNSRLYPWIGLMTDLELSRNELYNEQALKRLTIVPFKKKVFKNGKIINFDYTIGIVFAERNGPAIGNAACYRIPNIDFCAVISNNQISFYTTREDIKVCDIASVFGGGGHDGAAGFTISYQSANIFNTNHFFNIIDCAGRICNSDNS